ncbi:MAG: sigma 54-interacting transcriptional regulator [Thermodesulfobacteriota bacterium]
MPVLFAFREDRFGFRYEIGESVVLGRSPECDLILFDRGTSRQHAEIYKSDNGYILKDLGSTNGTLHNSVRLVGEAPLKRNDEIKVGQEIFLFDPDLDVAVGREGAVLLVGDVEPNPSGVLVGATETDLNALDRGSLAPLYQVATALASRPQKGRVLRQAAYALTRIFQASALALLWPESAESPRLSALLSRPEGRRLAIPRPMAELVLKENRAVIWPRSVTQLDFVNGRRFIKEADLMSMAVPLKAQGQYPGLLYVEAGDRFYSAKDLNFLTALGGLIGSALVNAALVQQLENRLIREEEDVNAGGDFIGDDHQTKALLATANQVGQTGARILLTGEVGTGKEVLARRIHSQSHRRRGPFISVNCSAIVSGQLESTLFGQEAGAMSEDGTPGALEKADGGTIFIRHVDHLSLSGQAELLRTMEEGLVYRVGSSKPRPSNFRIISSSTADLAEMVKQGEFREDLFQRLSEVTLTMPPLREVKGDIITLARYFLSRAAKEKGLPVPDLDPAAALSLQSYFWPGNVGELKNVADHLVMFARGDRILLDDLPPELRYASQAFLSPDGEPEAGAIAEVEKLYIRRALARTKGQEAQAAQILGLSEGTLESLIRSYGLSEV